MAARSFVIFSLNIHTIFLLRVLGDKDSAPDNRTAARIRAGGHGGPSANGLVGPITTGSWRSYYLYLQPPVKSVYKMRYGSYAQPVYIPFSPKRKMPVTTADTALANHYNEEYPKQVWLLVATFLFLLGVTRWGSVVLRRVFPSRGGHPDVEADGRVVRHSPSIRRLPLAIVNAYRVLAFRTTLTVGPFSLNLAEVALTIAYIVALFIWSFINGGCCNTLLMR